jgi:sugar (pentulose or hexulose) kinase
MLLAKSMFYSATQVHVAGGANDALYPVRQDGFDNSTQTPNSTATSATLNPSRSFMSVSPFPAERIMAIAFSSQRVARMRAR